ncbi:MAG: ABC transporter ATP-binding protein [Ignavibacteriales bacterium]|nr:ABC transporter ATP-binding protein [Ignavibacteriales bacterium]
MSAESILQTFNLGKRYGQRWAVKQLNLDIKRADVFGFLGPNGAGKSTTIRMLLSLIKPTEGSVSLFGHELHRHRAQALKSVGGIVEKPDFYLYLSAVRNLEIVGALNGGIHRARIFEVLDLVGLRGRERDKVKTYSHGMKQRLGIAQALLSNPDMVILDEPTSGLDPQGMKEVRGLITHLSRDQQKTVVLSSHLLNEVEHVATRMAIINKGELVVQGGVHELLNQGEGFVLLQAEPKRAVKRVLKASTKIVSKFVDEPDCIKIFMDFADVPALNQSLVRNGVRVQAIVPRRSLEDYFLSITESEDSRR